MKPGRKPAPEPQAPTDVLDHVTLAKDSAALTELGRRSSEIAERFGDGLPYERNRLISEGRFFMAQSAGAFLELGKRLLQIKENEPRGDFLEIVTERLGLEVRAAQRAMQAAFKYLSPTLAAKATTLSHLDKSKLLALMFEEDDVLDALTEGGTVAGLTLPEIESMSVRELRTALAEEKKKLAIKQRQLDGKDKKINDLETDLSLAKNTGASLEEAETIQLAQLRGATENAETALAQLLAAVDDVMRMPSTDATALAARQTLDYVAQRFLVAAAKLNLTLNFEGHDIPAHMQRIREGLTSKRKAA